MNWADYLLGVGSGILIFVLWILSVIMYALRNQQKIASYTMKRMMKSANKNMKAENANR